MDNKWVQIIGTILIGGGLFNWIIPLFIMIFGSISKPSELNEYCFTLGGKINRKWFFLNNLIYMIFIVILISLAFIFKNWVMWLILVPYAILWYILNWGNVYKRINAITNNHKFSCNFTYFFALFALFSKGIYKQFSDDIALIISIIVLFIWLLILILPSKKINHFNSQITAFNYPHEYIINELQCYSNKYNNPIIIDFVNKFSDRIKKDADKFNNNKSYYKDDNSIDVKATEQMTVQFIMQYIDEKLTSGEFHIYRGVLNEQGQDLLRIYKQIIRELIRLEIKDEDTKKIIDEDWINRNINSLLNDIKMVG